MQARYFYPGQNNAPGNISDYVAYFGIVDVRLTDTAPYAEGTVQLRIDSGSWIDLIYNGNYWVADDTGNRLELSGSGVHNVEIRDSANPTNIIDLCQFDVEDTADGCDSGWVEHEFTINSSDQTIDYQLSGFNQGPYSNAYYNVDSAGFVEITPSVNTQVQIADYTNPSISVVIRTTKSAVNCDYPSATIYAAEFYEPLLVTYSKTNTSSDIVCDGTIDISVTGGSGNYYYVWSDGVFTQDRTGLCADTYTVTVNDYDTGESYVLNVTITSTTGDVGETDLVNSVNRWNFLRWFSLGDIEKSELPTIDYNVDNLYYVPMTGEDTISFYINFDTVIDDADFENWKLGLFNCDFTEVTNFDVLQKDEVGNGFYNVYGSFLVPNLSKYDLYYLVIYNEVSNDTKYISNPLRYTNKTEGTYIVEYSHSKSIYNFFYENVPAFTNKFRIDLEILRPQNKENAIGYELIDGTFKTARSTSGKTYEFITGYWDEFAHDAFHAMVKHDNLIINNKNWLRNERDEVTVEWSQDWSKAQGVVRLDDIAYAISNKMC